MNTVPTDHPRWCSPARCEVQLDGSHMSDAVRVASRRTLRMLIMLIAPLTGSPVRLRLVCIGDDLINSVDLDLDTATLAAASITKVVSQARPED